MRYKVPLVFYKNVKNCYTTLKKPGENKKIRSKSNIKRKIGEKLKEEKSAIKSIKALYESSEKVIKLFNYHSKVGSNAKQRSIHGEGLRKY